MKDALQIMGLAPSKPQGFSNATGADVASLEQSIKTAQAQLASDANRMSSLDATMNAWSRQITEDEKKIRELEAENKTLSTQASELNSRRGMSANAHWKLQRAKHGEFCKRVPFGWFNDCLRVNTAKYNDFQNRININKAEIGKLSTRVNTNRNNLLKAEKDMVSTRERVNASQVELNKSVAMLAEAMGNNNAEVLAQKSSLEAARAKLAQIEANASLRADLLAQDGAALQASIDLKQDVVPMLVGFGVLVAIALVYKYFFKEGQA